MEDMVSAYIRRCTEEELGTKAHDPPATQQPTVEEVYDIQVVDMFGML